MQISATRSGMSQGSSIDCTTSSIALSPLWLYQPIATASVTSTTSSASLSGTKRRLPSLSSSSQNTTPNAA